MIRFIQVIIIALIGIGNAQKTNSIDFVIKNLGVNVDGHFNSFEINTQFNTKGDLVSIYGKVEVKSIETGIESRDEHLLKEDYFHQSKYQYIILESTSMTKNDDNTYSVLATLTIKGKTKNISIPLTLERQQNRIFIASAFEINRKDFGVGGSSFILGKTVKVQVKHYHNLL
ncbi:MAG: YceI family protein [Winogradskyella sp.]|uniref:YceI family protein n=1 Tax=Winogradskyella sp. TaxID=1883156 RepID=UPI0025DC80E8|nr:YceI family protein [Winogradskyella sp.]NRB59633.1 YceI family protein [Winogradskyella sp.]